MIRDQSHKSGHVLHDSRKNPLTIDKSQRYLAILLMHIKKKKKKKENIINIYD